MKKVKTVRQNWIKFLDKLASGVTHKRTNGICEKCGKPAKAAHHIFSRRYMATRWDTANLLNICYPCHIHFFHSRVEEARDWLIKKMGEAKYDRLKIRALGRTTCKPDYELILLDLNKQLKTNA